MFGYYGRFLAHSTPAKARPFIQQNLLILTAAPFLAATMYMSLGRITRALGGQDHAIISTRWMTPLFVIIDIGYIGTQFVGSILPASGDPSAIRTARIVLIAGLITQLVALSIFLLTCWRVTSGVKSEAGYGNKFDPSINYMNHFRAIGLATSLMILRSIVRSAEFLQGTDGFVISHEVFIYVFDAVPMWAVMAIFLAIHPTRLVRDARKWKESRTGNVLLEAGRVESAEGRTTKQMSGRTAK